MDVLISGIASTTKGLEEETDSLLLILSSSRDLYNDARQGIWSTNCSFRNFLILSKFYFR